MRQALFNRMNIYFLLTCIFLFSSTHAFAEERLNYIAPSKLKDTSRLMKTPGYWISRHLSPDEVVMDEKKIQLFNDYVRENLHLTRNIFQLVNQYKMESLLESFEKTYNGIKDKALYDAKGNKGNDTQLEKIKQNMNWPGIVSGVSPRYGIIVHYTDVRYFPTAEPQYVLSHDIDFDELQNSSFDVGTAVAVVHQSADKKWFYVYAKDCEGWVRVEDIALADAKQVQIFLTARPAGVIRPKADLYADLARREQVDYLRMGARLPLSTIEGEVATVLMPTRDKEGALKVVTGYMNAEDISDGFLTYTPRHLLTQAFAMLNAPYGWGGMYGEQDCSAFIQEIFATVGIDLPRNSSEQAQVGRALEAMDERIPDHEKVAVIIKATPGAAVLTMKGHILFYVGSVDGKPYAIHAIWAYRQAGKENDIPRVINRVVVSDLTIGEGSKKGSLIRRLNGVRELEM